MFLNLLLGGYKNIYQYIDQLGNVRVSYGRNSTGALEITDANDYYPFGMNHLKTGISYFAQGSYKSNKYNGKELQETGMYSYGWREYMPDIARWNGIDQLAESYYSHSPYAYVMNNPINMFDPDGRKNEAWLEEAPAWLQETWNNTPDGTNSYWTNSGSSSGGGGGHFVYTGGTAGLTAGYGIGSTVDYAGNFNSYYGTVTNGVLSYTYWTNGAPASGYTNSGGQNYQNLQGIVGYSGKLDLNSSNSNSTSNSFLDNSFDWIQNNPIKVSQFAGMIQAGSTVAEKGLSNWNGASNITKSRIFAETISTKLPFSAKALETASTALKWGGRVVGAVGVANTLYQYGKGNISGTRAVVDGVMGVAGFFPATAWISVGYFAGMALYETYGNDGKPLF